MHTSQFVGTPAQHKEIITIASGASLSNEFRLSGFSHVGLIMPAAFDGTVITFQVSADGLTYKDLYDNEGNEVGIVVTDNKAIALETVKEALVPFLYAKLRSGSSATPTTETAERTIFVSMRG